MIGCGFLFVLMIVLVMLVLVFLFGSFVVSVLCWVVSFFKVSIYVLIIIFVVIVLIIFVLIYNYLGGFLNVFFGVFGIDLIVWIGDLKWVFLVIVVFVIWFGMGLIFLIMVVVMVDILVEYYEVVVMEGVNWWQKIVYIIIFQMKNVVFYLFIIGFVVVIQ